MIPEAPSIDTEKIDRVCELTDGCEYWESDKTYEWVFYTHFDEHDQIDATEDFEEAMADLVGIDEDYFNLLNFDERDTQIRAYSDDDKEDKNWEVKVFAKVGYEDEDEEEEEYIYVLITTILDEGEYDSLTVEEVSRNFEF